MYKATDHILRIGWIQISGGVHAKERTLRMYIPMDHSVPYTISQNLKNVSSIPKETLLLKVSN